MDRDLEMMNEVTANEDFIRGLFLDTLNEWSLAKEYGEFLVKNVPQLFLGHVVLARAHRHLGERDRAREKIAECRKMTERADFDELSSLPDFEYEERQLLSEGEDPDLR
jgi:hypothetical protein